MNNADYEEGFLDGIDFYFYLQNYFGMGAVYEIWPNSDKQDWNFPNDSTKKYNHYWTTWVNMDKNAVYFFNKFVKDGPDQRALIRWWKRETAKTYKNVCQNYPHYFARCFENKNNIDTCFFCGKELNICDECKGGIIKCKKCRKKTLMDKEILDILENMKRNKIYDKLDECEKHEEDLH